MHILKNDRLANFNAQNFVVCFGGRGCKLVRGKRKKRGGLMARKRDLGEKKRNI